MTETQSRRLLVVANRTESAPQLLKAVEDRAGAGYEITLMIPPERDPDAPDGRPRPRSTSSGELPAPSR